MCLELLLYKLNHFLQFLHFLKGIERNMFAATVLLYVMAYFVTGSVAGPEVDPESGKLSNVTNCTSVKDISLQSWRSFLNSELGIPLAASSHKTI